MEETENPFRIFWIYSRHNYCVTIATTPKVLSCHLYQEHKKFICFLFPVLRIQTLFIRIRILLYNLIRIWIKLFNLTRIWIRQFDPDPDPYRFKEVMYLKQYFYYILTWFSLSVGPIGPTQKAYFVKFSLPVNFVVLMSSLWTVLRIRIRIQEDPSLFCWIRIRNFRSLFGFGSGSGSSKLISTVGTC